MSFSVAVKSALRVAGFRPGEQCLQKPFSLAAIAQKARETLDAK